jgi:hypothetical protein
MRNGTSWRKFAGVEMRFERIEKFIGKKRDLVIPIVQKGSHNMKKEIGEQRGNLLWRVRQHRNRGKHDEEQY